MAQSGLYSFDGFGNKKEYESESLLVDDGKVGWMGPEIDVSSQKLREDIGAMRDSFLKVANPCLISLNGGLALKCI